MDNSVVIVENLNKSYGKRQILKDISFNIRSNEIVGFIGPNGAGKSTTMKCLCNLVFPDSGTIKICGYDIRKEREKALSCQAALIEAPGLYKDMTGKENINLIAKIRKVDKKRVEEIIEFTKLEKHIDEKVSNYSMGMKQRLGLAIALLCKPKFVILDEPTNGLDPMGIIDFRNTLKQLMKEEISILFSSHQLGEIEKLADRIICINQGRIINTPEVISPKNEYILQLSDAQKAIAILDKRIKPEAIIRMSEDMVKVTIVNSDFLTTVIKVLVNNEIKLIDIYKVTYDMEQVYQKVYGDRNV